ncbi:MAG TPA: LysR family transcriptional regulator [Allosphingosinicella sp.]|nr:LysR family transcriptional regulator [Allosphingosinicella sp.]
MQQIDLNLLAQLAELLQTRSVTGAAARLGISQPAMSRSLAALREMLGDPLLVRTRGGMILTARAEALIQPLQDWLAGADRLVVEPALDPSRLTRRFRVIAGDFALRAVLAPALPAFLAAAPQASLDVLPDTGDLRDRLAGNDADLALAPANPDRHLIHDRLLMREDQLCLVRAGHPLLQRAAATRLRTADLAQWPEIAVGAPGHAVRSRTLATLPTAAAGARLLPECDAFILAPASACEDWLGDPRLRLLEAPEEVRRAEHWVLWHNRTHGDRAVQWLIDLIARAAADGEERPSHLRLTLAAAE